jgi:hypothetical protein
VAVTIVRGDITDQAVDDSRVVAFDDAPWRAFERLGATA